MCQRGRKSARSRRRISQHPIALTEATGSGEGRLRVLHRAAPEHGVALDQLENSLVERTAGLEARFAQALVRYDIVPLVGVAANRREVNVEPGHIFLDEQRQLFF